MLPGLDATALPGREKAPPRPAEEGELAEVPVLNPTAAPFGPPKSSQEPSPTSERVKTGLAASPSSSSIQPEPPQNMYVTGAGGELLPNLRDGTCEEREGAPRSVRFSTTLVTDTWTRPRLSRKERQALYYSSDQCDQWKNAAAKAARRQAKRRRRRQNVADAHLREGVQEAFAKEDAAEGRTERDPGVLPPPLSASEGGGGGSSEECLVASPRKSTVTVEATRGVNP